MPSSQAHFIAPAAKNAFLVRTGRIYSNVENALEMAAIIAETIVAHGNAVTVGLAARLFVRAGIGVTPPCGAKLARDLETLLASSCPACRAGLNSEDSLLESLM